MRNKHELYALEQQEIIKKMIDILQLDTSSSITLWHLDNDTSKQRKLMALIPEIRKWFAFSRIEGASEPARMKRPWLSLIKKIVSKEYEITSRDARLYREEPTVRTKRYTFQNKLKSNIKDLTPKYSD